MGLRIWSTTAVPGVGPPDFEMTAGDPGPTPRKLTEGEAGGDGGWHSERESSPGAKQRTSGGRV